MPEMRNESMLSPVEKSSEAVENIAFVQVFDGVGEIDCVGRVGQKSVAEFHYQTAAVGADRRRLLLCRRHYDF